LRSAFARASNHVQHAVAAPPSTHELNGAAMLAFA
jgi:hypothetical protein